MFDYKIEDCKVIITRINDNTITSINIPRFIDSYPVAYIYRTIYSNFVSL